MSVNFEFWKENKVSQQYHLTIADLQYTFHKWLKRKDVDWIKHYDIEAIVRNFVGDRNGLNSVCEINTYNQIAEILRPVKNEYLSKIGQDL